MTNTHLGIYLFTILNYTVYINNHAQYFGDIFAFKTSNWSQVVYVTEKFYKYVCINSKMTDALKALIVREIFNTKVKQYYLTRVFTELALTYYASCYLPKSDVIAGIKVLKLYNYENNKTTSKVVDFFNYVYMKISLGAHIACIHVMS